eukprot:scaffold2764_cov399-Prasinococcus_capsulatus_cf.AAC.1
MGYLGPRGTLGPPQTPPSAARSLRFPHRHAPSRLFGRQAPRQRVVGASSPHCQDGEGSTRPFTPATRAASSRLGGPSGFSRCTGICQDRALAVVRVRRSKRHQVGRERDLRRAPTAQEGISTPPALR